MYFYFIIFIKGIFLFYYIYIKNSCGVIVQLKLLLKARHSLKTQPADLESSKSFCLISRFSTVRSRII